MISGFAYLFARIVVRLVASPAEISHSPIQSRAWWLHVGVSRYLLCGRWCGGCDDGFLRLLERGEGDFQIPVAKRLVWIPIVSISQFNSSWESYHFRRVCGGSVLGNLSEEAWSPHDQQEAELGEMERCYYAGREHTEFWDSVGF